MEHLELKKWSYCLFLENACVPCTWYKLNDQESSSDVGRLRSEEEQSCYFFFP